MLRTWANELGYKDAVKLLDATLKEEKNTDSALTQLAESQVNMHAESRGSGLIRKRDNASEPECRKAQPVTTEPAVAD